MCIGHFLQEVVFEIPERALFKFAIFANKLENSKMMALSRER